MLVQILSERKLVVVYYLRIAGRILCLISGFSRKVEFARPKASLIPAVPKFNFFVLSKSASLLKLETT
jgi:hypothetical protein